MEFLTILLSSLLGLVSPTGLVVDRVAENEIRKRFVSVEQLKVRIDNAPSYQIINGKADRVRLAGHGLFPVQEVRIDTLELETDPISLKRSTGQLENPVQAGVRVVLKPTDLNRALRSPAVTARLRNLGIQLLRRREAQQIQRYDFLNPQLTFLPGGRMRLQVDLKQQGYSEKLAILAEAEPKISVGRSLQLTNLKIWANGQPTPDTIVKSIANLISTRFDLKRLEKSGITARVLAFKVDPAALEMATFIQVRPR